jgi:hypothetical protein
MNSSRTEKELWDEIEKFYLDQVPVLHNISEVDAWKEKAMPIFRKAFEIAVFRDKITK